jgi:hypothetical protein
MKIEARGVRCLDCKALDMRKYPDAATNGFGWCPAPEVGHFVSVTMARNCMDFDAAPAEAAKQRAPLIDVKAVMFWRK